MTTKKYAPTVTIQLRYRFFDQLFFLVSSRRSLDFLSKCFIQNASTFLRKVGKFLFYFFQQLSLKKKIFYGFFFKCENICQSNDSSMEEKRSHCEAKETVMPLEWHFWKIIIAHFTRTIDLIVFVWHASDWHWNSVNLIISNVTSCLLIRCDCLAAIMSRSKLSTFKNHSSLWSHSLIEINICLNTTKALK